MNFWMTLKSRNRKKLCGHSLWEGRVAERIIHLLSGYFYWREPHSVGLILLGLLALMSGFQAGTVTAAELQTRYATLHYDNDEQLQTLNRELLLGGELSWQLRKRSLVTIRDEVTAKIDILVEQVQVVLEMYPERMAFTILLFSDEKAAQAELARRHGERVDFISFYSRRDNTLYLSVKHARLKVVAHELAHVVVQRFSQNSMPNKIHELLAQYAASHIVE